MSAGAGRKRCAAAAQAPVRAQLRAALGSQPRPPLTCAPALTARARTPHAESLSTLKFAQRAKRVVNAAVQNEDLDHRTLLRRYERELRKLRSELQRKQQDLVDKRALLEVRTPYFDSEGRRVRAYALGWVRKGGARSLCWGMSGRCAPINTVQARPAAARPFASASPLAPFQTRSNTRMRQRQVEEQKRRAEADKLAAITALEHRSREFMAQKEEKQRLEAKIRAMQSQLLIGGQKIEDTLVFR